MNTNKFLALFINNVNESKSCKKSVKNIIFLVTKDSLIKITQQYQRLNVIGISVETIIALYERISENHKKVLTEPEYMLLIIYIDIWLRV